MGTHHTDAGLMPNPERLQELFLGEMDSLVGLADGRAGAAGGGA